MRNNNFNSLQIREIFHLEFLRFFSRKIKAGNYALKGGANLRFFFGSIRYSEDMDIDISGIKTFALKDLVLSILSNSGFLQTMKSYGIEEVISPDMAKAKQTETTQWFKIHLITNAGEDFFTKIEFSKRGLKEGIVMETVAAGILKEYRMTPLLVRHYDIGSAIVQKIHALALRNVVQARDVFDLYMLYGKIGHKKRMEIEVPVLKKAYENVFSISYEEFRDAVVSYLSEEDQVIYGNPAVWDEIKLKTAEFIEGSNKDGKD